MIKIYSFLRYCFILSIWKRRAKKKQRPHIKIGNIPDFFKQLNSLNVSYIVMRYFDDVPLTPEQEKAKISGDIDILADAEDLKKICQVVAGHPGKVKLDLHSNRLILGTDIKRYTYYPPVFCQDLLSTRVLSKDNIYCPDDKHYLYSFAYHAVYHKGLRSGIPSGMPGVSDPIADTKHDIPSTLRELAAKAGEELPAELTLLALHEWLKERDWSMPYDLLPRWPNRTEVLEALFHLETSLLEKDMGNIRSICVYLLREDAIKAGITDQIVELLEEQYVIWDKVKLSSEQQERVIRKTRGGDWSKRKQIRLYLPEIAIVCHGKIMLPFSDIKKTTSASDMPNPNITFKRALRDKLKINHPDAADFMHGSDNDLEAMAYIKAVYGAEWTNKMIGFSRHVES